MRPRYVMAQPPEAADGLVALISEATGRTVWSAADIARLQRPRGFVLADIGRREAVALVSLAADEAEILDIGVRPASRGRGIGRQILDATCRLAAHDGAARVLLEVAEDNAPARGLYASAGFEQVGRRAGYYCRGSAAPVDALVLAKPL